MLLAWVLLAGCQPKDPLAWKVRGKTPVDLNAWYRSKRPALPSALGEEFDRAVAHIVARTPGALVVKDLRQATGEQNPLCRQLHGKTVRAVLIAGYQAANRTLELGIGRESENLLRLLRRAEQAETGDESRIDQRVAALQAQIERARANIVANERRLAELTTPES